MHKLALATALTAAIVIPSSWYSRPAQADAGYHRHRHHHHHWRHHHHRWGDRDWEIIRWSYGDCKIWFDDNGPPWGIEGKDWVLVAGGFRTWDDAWRELGHLQRHRKCA
jgi:hypothetical protein